jgi:superfamily II RNA helicase
MLTREDLAFMYLEQLPFEPYPFQEQAILDWFSSEQGTLVCAPTGMGKTLIAEAGIYEAMKTGKKAYYTTPLIALTEQKYREIQAALERWGYSKHYVGLVTGNRRENPDAPILVVVAEILFNRLLMADSRRQEAGGSIQEATPPSSLLPSAVCRQPSLNFDDVTTVVMDEFHQFADPERGLVWEFTLQLLPKHVRTLLISATVGNAYDFVAWLRDHGGRRLSLIESTERKVPLTYQWIGDQLLTEHIEIMCRGSEDDRFTPALVFCFDRNECWNIADQIRGRDLISAEQQKTITKILEDYDWKEGAGPHLKQLLIRGVGIHHAGILPKYRRIVEDLFQQKLLSVCICTETLAAGINLPARSVVLPSILKGRPGEKKLLESSSAHQIFGRAGRPQYDTQGFVFALAHEDDVKIARWKAKYDQIPEDTKDPKLREMKKKMKKKAPTRRSTEQYWSEEQFWKLKDMPPGRLASRGTIPWRLLAHIISLDSDIEPIRKMIGRRLMSDKWIKEGQKQLDEMLTTLHQAGFIKLILENGEEWESAESVT